MLKTSMKCAVVIAVCLTMSGVSASPEKLGVSAQHPSVSPSGNELAFAADFDGPARIWASQIDGTNLRRISGGTENTRVDSEPVWSPDGQKIAYSSKNGSTFDIWVMQANGAYPLQLTAGANNTSPSWSPDGQRLVFVSDREGTKDVWLMRSDGSQPTKLVSSQAQENSPRFSPDGTQVVFSKTDGDVARLMIVNVNGTGLRELTNGNFQDWEPSWGSRGILFVSNRGGNGDRWKVWSVQPNGSALTKLGDTPGHDPTWLPDGRVAFIDEGMSSKSLSAVSILNPADGTKRVVADVQGYITPIDIRPGKPLNRINPASAGKVQVAVLSTRSLDATTEVAQKSLTFGRTGAEPSLAFCAKKFIDVNADGLPDLVCRFSLRYTGFKLGDTVGILRFDDSKGVPYEGRESVMVAPGEDPDDFKDN